MSELSVLETIGLKEYLDEANYVAPLLEKRYQECDSSQGGHLRANPSINYCNNCFRHLKYETPQTSAELESRRDIPFMFQPLDAPVMMERARREIEHQKTMDRLSGLHKLIEELGNYPN